MGATLDSYPGAAEGTPFKRLGQPHEIAEMAIGPGLVRQRRDHPRRRWSQRSDRMNAGASRCARRARRGARPSSAI
jgi:hypothetical protein